MRKPYASWSTWSIDYNGKWHHECDIVSGKNPTRPMREYAADLQSAWRLIGRRDCHILPAGRNPK